jgi:hypothetical protein
MKIGYAQSVITPSLERPIYLAGFGNNRRAETVHDDLTVRALSIQAGEMVLVLCALDLIGFFRSDVLDVIHQVHQTYPNTKIVIASTHTHHGPDTMGLWGPDNKTRGVDPDYMADLKSKIADTILAALSGPSTSSGPALKPATVRSTSVHVPGLVKNARNPEIVDDELTLAQFLDPENQPLVTLMNFPCHPEVLWEHNPHLTADYPGSLRSEVERVTGAPCIFFSGALGGMLTPDVQDHSFEEAEGMGKKLAEEGLKALDAVSSEQLSVVRIQKKELQVRLTNILYKIAFKRKLLPDVREKGRLTTEVNLIKIGGLWLATVPGEMLPRLGLALKASLREAGAKVAGVIGLANDELGYIIPAEDFKYPLNPLNPGKHYEETNSVSKEVGPKVLDAVRSLL